MKTFKLTDLAAQLLLLLAGSIYLLIYINDTEFVLLYFLIGGWQFISFLVHWTLTESWIHRKDRLIYGKTLLCFLISGIISYVAMLYQFPLLLFYLAALLVLSPVAAIWYFHIGLQELKTIKNKELIHLKR